ncbi:hypothetical protein COV93_08155 [Candidatus Woesearchaeota archaeon CG11_big_fil_rev_8_21_14_0_20_43_8]|nr:MAG: hypothetical protein COV93_08155 [Candidatus Woesearchaeota archaeon CG11_big_fil_rev_8_21_14_0_20_43_8]
MAKKKERKTQTWAIILILICTLVTASGQLFLKLGADRMVFDIIGLLKNYFLIIGCIIYAIAAIMMIVALRGGEVSVLYPLFATSYVWVTIIAKYFLDETIGVWRWLGVGTLVIGVIFISMGSE